MHYVYVFGVGLGNSDCPPYDEGVWLKTMMDHTDVSNRINNYRKVWSNCQWVWEPMLMENAELLATDAEINLRINRPYEKNVVGNENLGSPMYNFTIDEPTLTVQGDRLESALDRINVVPNPYYAYSSYETTKLDTRVKITNLPERCTVNIFNMQGALVRSFEKDDPITSLDWDLKNHLNVPIAGGLYVIHVTIPVTDASGNVTEHERIIKWYGALRPPDLDNL
jgi:translation elongation factor EF-1beta